MKESPLPPNPDGMNPANLVGSGNLGLGKGSMLPLVDGNTDGGVNSLVGSGGLGYLGAENDCPPLDTGGDGMNGGGSGDAGGTNGALLKENEGGSISLGAVNGRSAVFSVTDGGEETLGLL